MKILSNSHKLSTLVSMGCVVLVGISLTACSSGPSQSAGGDHELVSQMPAATGPVDKITWNLTAGEPTTLDPRNAATYSSGQVVANLCDFLLQKDADFNLHANLAKVEQTTPTEVTITLRDDVRFWDGSPVTVQDVVYSLERAADPENSIVAYAFDAVDSIKAAGDQKVVVKFSSPDSSFVTGMSTIAGAVIKKEWAEKAGDAVGTSSGGLMCSGPYKLDSWKSGSSLFMSANDDYWNDELRPKAKTVDFTFVTDTTAASQALSTGEIDGSYELPPTVIPNLENSKNGSLIFGPSTQDFGISFAGPDGPFKDPSLRQAMQKALDRKAIAKSVFKGSAEPLYTMLTTTTWPNESSDIYQKAYATWEKEREFDLDAAKQLVEDSNYDGQTVVLGTTAGDEVENTMAQLVQQQAKEIGITVKIQALQPLVAAQAEYDAAARKGLDLLVGSSFNSSQNPIEPLFFTVIPEQPYNTTEYDNSEVTELLTAARGEFDAKKQAELLVKAQSIYEADNVTIPLVETHTTTFVNKDLTGAVTSFAYWSMPQMAFIGDAG